MTPHLANDLGHLFHVESDHVAYAHPRDPAMHEESARLYGLACEWFAIADQLETKGTGP
jgi:hypothetical protein